MSLQDPNSVKSIVEVVAKEIIEPKLRQQLEELHENLQAYRASVQDLKDAALMAIKVLGGRQDHLKTENEALQARVTALERILNKEKQ